MNPIKQYQIHVTSDITILDKDFHEEEADKKLRRKIAKPKAYNTKKGWKFFKGRKQFRFKDADVIAKMDSMIAENDKYEINLKK